MPFDRLIRMLDEIAPQLDEEIVAQVNGSGYLPRHINTIDLLPPDEFDRLFSSARLIVAHAGIGTIITAMQQQKPIIIFRVLPLWANIAMSTSWPLPRR